MNVINIYMQRDARNALRRRERLYHDVSNPLEVYDDVEIKKLFRFERVHIISITEDVYEYLQRVIGRSRALAPLQRMCIALRFYASGCMQLSLAASTTYIRQLSIRRYGKLQVLCYKQSTTVLESWVPAKLGFITYPIFFGPSTACTSELNLRQSIDIRRDTSIVNFATQ